MESLPLEVLVEVSKELGVQDMCRLGAVSRGLHKTMGDNRLQKMALSGRGLSTEQPFLHAQALYTGKPRLLGTFAFRQADQSAALGPVALDGHRLLLDPPLSGQGLRSVDLRTGETKYEDCYSSKSQTIHGKMPPDALAVAQHNGRTCRWTSEGLYLGAALHRMKYPGANAWSGFMDDCYAYLLSWDPGLWLTRTRLSDMQNDYFHFDYDGYGPSIRAAGDSYFLSSSVMWKERPCYSLLQLDPPSLTSIISDYVDAVWRGIAYTVRDGAILARALSGSRGARIVDDVSDYLFVNDSYLLGFDNCCQSAKVYAFDPELSLPDWPEDSALIGKSSRCSEVTTSLEWDIRLGEAYETKYFPPGSVPKITRKKSRV